MGRRKRHGHGNKRGGGHQNPVVRKNKAGAKIFPTNKDKHGEEGMLDYLNSLGTHARKALGVGGATVFQPKEECWESGIEMISSCGAAPASIPVTIGVVAQMKFNALMQKYPRIEWLAYLLGEPGSNHVDDIVIPKQKVTAVRVDVDPQGVNVQTIGVIHSHHGMGNGFSGTDHAYINQNHDISLCIAHGGIAGQVRTETACGKYIIVPAKVSHKIDGLDLESFVKDASDKITENTYTQSYYGGQYHGNRNFTGHQNLGLEDSAEAPVGVGAFDEEDTFFGLADLADTYTDDLTENPDQFDIIDLVGVKEIIRETIRVGRNREIFESLYKNLLDSNGFEQGEEHFCVPLELMDELDSSWDLPLNALDRNALVGLLGKLEDSITLLMMEQEEAGELDFTETGDSLADMSSDVHSSLHLPTDEELWSTGDSTKTNEWNAGQEETDVLEDSDDSKEETINTTEHSDNLWSTGSQGTRMKKGNA